MSEILRSRNEGRHPAERNHPQLEILSAPPKPKLEQAPSWALRHWRSAPERKPTGYLGQAHHPAVSSRQDTKGFKHWLIVDLLADQKLAEYPPEIWKSWPNTRTNVGQLINWNREEPYSTRLKVIPTPAWNLAKYSVKSCPSTRLKSGQVLGWKPSKYSVKSRAHIDCGEAPAFLAAQILPHFPRQRALLPVGQVLVISPANGLCFLQPHNFSSDDRIFTFDGKLLCFSGCANIACRQVSCFFPAGQIPANFFASRRVY